jgi:L-alanine-DL-glutamate epimerase-like enolase superfamily enzyme
VLIEQPFPAGADDALLGRPGPVAICADESAHTRAELQDLARRYDAVNVKLDKTGGLTEALATVPARPARLGLGVMVGCMVAGSISMAPAVLLAGLADLDGCRWPALARQKTWRTALKYADGVVAPPVRRTLGLGSVRRRRCNGPFGLSSMITASRTRANDIDMVRNRLL